ncbi:nuclease harbi1-like protein [Lasius niger]|uniref:Nuclease harbi1-like protein n=1 Tax=Lasius niger TaxID=67767 RepID=A0A0J7JZB8_LASNI|nr:nuclease harbi1-like protein [Lasius niger]
MSPVNCENLFRALPCLHNFIMMGEEGRNLNDREYCSRNIIDVETEDGTITDGEWKKNYSSNFARFDRVGANRAGDTAKGMRNYLRDYFISSIGEEQAPWQYIRAFRGDIINLPE